MQVYSFSELSEATLSELVALHVEIDTSDNWDALQEVGLTAAEIAQIDYHKSILRNLSLVVLNEGTLWARAIYPLLVLAEHAYIRAWTGVPLKATYPSFQLEGVADGALAPAAAGKPRQPYFIVYAAKRGVNAPDPQVQLYGQMLAASRLNWENDAESSKGAQEIFGCYAVSGSWTFVRGIVGDIDTGKPTFTAACSREYHGIFEAETIVQILKAIVAKQL